MLRRSWPFVLLWSAPLHGQATTADVVRRAGALTSADPCRAQGNEDIVLCGRDRTGDAARFRLPLPDEREGRPTTRDGAPRAVKAPEHAARACGLFAGQRRCDKAEARAYGLGGGTDPLSIVAKLGTLLADPDADMAPPVTLPPGFVPPR